MNNKKVFDYIFQVKFIKQIKQLKVNNNLID